MTYRFVHISDLHLPPLPAVRPAQICNKRLLGYLSWKRKRRYLHKSEVVVALEKDMAGQAADHICITGDITNLGLPLEFQAADRWLKKQAKPGSVTFVPGNHDAYAPGSLDALHEHFHRWLPDDFPSATRCGNVLFIGVSTAVATAPFLATGRVGRDQLDRLASMLEETRAEDRYRVLLLHHPPSSGIVKRRKALTDSEDLARLLRRQPVDLILHGHGHRAVRYALSGGRGAIPVFGAGAASLSHRAIERSGHYHVFEMNDRELRVLHRRYRPDSRRFVPAGMEALRRG
jgi:3',5'-cyclic AMP phosphodiesterase CpdA